MREIGPIGAAEPIDSHYEGARASGGTKLGSKLKQLRVECIAFRRVMRGPMAVWTERNHKSIPGHFSPRENVMNVQETTISSVVRA